MKKFNSLHRLGAIILMLFATLGTSTQIDAQDLKYGDVIHLQNCWNGNRGGFLDTRGYDGVTDNFLAVSTAKAYNRDGGSGSWKVMSASGKANGSPVLVGDEIHLQNQWHTGGGYLDTRGYSKTGNHLAVTTAKVANRSGGSGIWRISAANSSNGTPVAANSAIRLQNKWNRYSGGFLDVKDHDTVTNNHLAVSTSNSPTRQGDSGTWKVIIQ